MRLTTLLLAASALGGCTNTYASARDDNGMLFNSIEDGDFDNQAVGNWADAMENRALPMGLPLTRAFIVGRWSPVTPECDNAMTFNADGSASRQVGTTRETARWTVADSTLSITTADGNQEHVHLYVEGPDRFRVIESGGEGLTFNRCR